MPRAQTRTINAWISGIILATITSAFMLALAAELSR
jgi:Na+/proline symporter